jgi:hypothetical protein
MINKSELQRIISKYSLNGMVESVKWATQNKQLNIKFNAPTKDMIGEVTHTNFDLADSEIAVYDTPQLDKLLSITSGDLDLQLEKIGKVFTRLVIGDVNYTLSYTLSDLMLIQEPGVVKDPDNYTVECTLESDAISSIIKAKNALQSDLVLFVVGRNFDGDQVLTLMFGDASSHTNKIEYIIPGTKIEDDVLDFKVPFNSEMLKTVLSSNKDANSAIMSLNTQGLLKLVFSGENWTSTYYMVRKADQ